MGILRRFLSIGVGVAAGALAYKLLQDYNETNVLNGDYVEVPMPEEADTAEPEADPASQPEYSPQQRVQRPDQGPNVNPVTLGTAEKPLTEDGRLDPTRIASPEDFVEWDDMGCQS